jgi:2,4-dienoyl-CoA reductase-like NADH-dependent reductase (Old Yellow Enzyme family)
MTRYDIDVVIAQFTQAAQLAYQAGFQGVEVHAARESQHRNETCIIY